MTITELINELQKLSPDTKVVIRGYEKGYNDILKIIPRKIKSDVDSYWYEGSYTDSQDEASINAIELYGENVNAKDSS